MTSPDFLSVLPIIVTLALALYTKHVVIGLFGGVVTAVVLLTGGHPLEVLAALIKTHLVGTLTDSYNAGVIVLMVFIGGFVALMVFTVPAGAQEPVIAATDHQAVLQSDDARLAANKRLVYNFWREVFEGGHLELADKYLTESYLQHNPNVPSGRQSFVDFFSQFTTAKPIKDRVEMPLVSIVAEKDMVILTFVQNVKDPEGDYATTWFDMFRIEDGKIAEHWAPARKM